LFFVTKLLFRVDNNMNVNTFSANVCLEGLFTEADVKSEGPTFLDEIIEDVRTECSKYGVVLQVNFFICLIKKKENSEYNT
jgi:hypothetical protein